MASDKKPEWMEMAEGDKSAHVRKVNKTLPVAAAVAAALVLGVGAIVAQTQEEPPANAETIATTETPAAEDPTTDTSANPAPSDAVTNAPSIKAPTVKTPKVTGGFQNPRTHSQTPKIDQLPTGRGGDDEGYDDDGRERHEGGEHHEGGERHEGGDDD